MFADVESNEFDLHYDNRVQSNQTQYIAIDGRPLILQLAGAPRHASERTPSIRGYRTPQAVAVAGWAEADRLAGVGVGGMGSGAPYGAHGDLAAAKPADAAGYSELDLA
jgi:hypothetical protein